MKKTKTTHASQLATSLASSEMSLLLVALLGATAMNQSASAATGTWNDAGGATWDTSATNWSGVSGTPWDSTNGSGNTALFSAAATPTVSGNVYANTITFGAETTLTGGTITLAGSSPTINGSGTGTNIIYSSLAGTNGLIKSGSSTVYLDPGNGFSANTFSGDITINGGKLITVRSNSLGDAAGAITVNSGGTLQVDWSSITRTGLVTVDGGVLQTSYASPVLTNNGSGFLLKNGGAINTILGGSGGLTVDGSRSYLYSANTYTGATVINAGGDLALLYGGDLPTDTALELSGVLLANNKNHTVGGLTGASTGLYYGDAAGIFTVNKVSGTDTYGGIIQNVGTFIKDGAGTLSLTNTTQNTSFPGALTVSNGVLELGGAGRLAAGSYSGAVSLSSNSSVLQIATSADQTLGGAISGSGSLTKSGAGTLTVSGSNSYNGGTTVNAGTLTASHASALGDAAGAITVNSGGTLNVNANMTRTGTVTVNGGDLGTGNGSTLTNNGGGFVLTGSYASTGGVVLAGSGGLTVSSSDARLWAQATYSGATTVNSGTLNLCGEGGITATSAVSIASGAAVNLTSYYAPTNVNRTIGGLTGAGVLYGAGGTVTVNKTSGTDIFSGDIQGGQGLIKDGGGTLALSGANTYTGATAVNAGGILAVAHANALGSTAGGTTVASGAQLRFSVDTNVSSGFTVGNEALTISGQGVTTGGALRNVFGDNTYQGKITLAAAATIGSAGNSSLTLDVASDNAIEASNFNLTFDGAGRTLVNDGISLGTGGLTKIGSGTTTLAGTNTYTGLTTVSMGTLAVNGSVAGAMTVASGATLQGSGTISGATTVSGNLKPGNSPGLLTFANSLTLDSTAVTTMEITGANSSGTRGTTYDAVNVASALTYGGTLALNFDTLFTQTGNYTFNLFDFNSTSGSFGSVSLAGVYSGSFSNPNDSGIWGLTQGDNTWSFNQSDGVLSFAVVPEPNVAMVAGSLALMALLRRRRD
jgi:autotransporter-associated beta strand protein